MLAVYKCSPGIHPHAENTASPGPKQEYLTYYSVTIVILYSVIDYFMNKSILKDKHFLKAGTDLVTFNLKLKTKKDQKRSQTIGQNNPEPYSTQVKANRVLP